MSTAHQPVERQEQPRTHFDRALDKTRRGFVAARDIGAALEMTGLRLKRGLGVEAEMKIARQRLQDLRLLIDDVEAHLRLSDAAEEHALGKKKKDSAGLPAEPV